MGDFGDCFDTKKLFVTTLTIPESLSTYGFGPKKLEQISDVVKFLNRTEGDVRFWRAEPPNICVFKFCYSEQGFTYFSLHFCMYHTYIYMLGCVCSIFKIRVFKP